MKVVAGSALMQNIQRTVESLGYKNSHGLVIMLDEMASAPGDLDAALGDAASGAPALLIGSCAREHYCREPIVRRALEGPRSHFRQIGEQIPEAILRADLVRLTAASQ